MPGGLAGTRTQSKFSYIVVHWTPTCIFARTHSMPAPCCYSGMQRMQPGHSPLLPPPLGRSSWLGPSCTRTPALGAPAAGRGPLDRPLKTVKTFLTVFPGSASLCSPWLPEQIGQEMQMRNLDCLQPVSPCKHPSQSHGGAGKACARPRRGTPVRCRSRSRRSPPHDCPETPAADGAQSLFESSGWRAGVQGRRTGVCRAHLDLRLCPLSEVCYMHLLT